MAIGVGNRLGIQKSPLGGGPEVRPQSSVNEGKSFLNNGKVKVIRWERTCMLISLCECRVWNEKLRGKSKQIETVSCSLAAHSKEFIVVESGKL